MSADSSRRAEPYTTNCGGVERGTDTARRRAKSASAARQLGHAEQLKQWRTIHRKGAAAMNGSKRCEFPLVSRIQKAR